jgi:tetratricopeptide (TPR) repeat protein
MLGAFLFCTYVLLAGGDDRVPTPAPREAGGSPPRNDASASANAANDSRKTNGQTTDSQADVIRSEGEARIARTPDPRESASRQPTADSTSTLPLPMPADSRAEDLKRQADLLAAQGNLSKAMAFYNEALVIAPRSAEIYRRRALVLLRLGDRVQAQADYLRFLELDPQAQNRVRQEIQLFEQSTVGSSAYAGGGTASDSSRYSQDPGSPGYVSPGETSTNPASISSYYNSDFANSFALQNRQSVTSSPYASTKPEFVIIAADRDYTLARNAFANADYDNAYMWAQNSNNHVPRARNHVLMAQTLFAQGIYSAAAWEARAAVAMEPLIDSTTLYSYYDFNVPRFRRHFQALQDFVRQNPSSADARFLLGYQHRILNQKEPAHAQLAIATVLEPLDTVAKEMLARDGVEVVGAEETAAKNMMTREGVGGSVRVGRVPPPPAPPAAPTEEPVKR